MMPIVHVMAVWANPAPSLLYATVQVCSHLHVPVAGMEHTESDGKAVPAPGFCLCASFRASTNNGFPVAHCAEDGSSGPDPGSNHQPVRTRYIQYEYSTYSAFCLPKWNGAA
ncbi:hypothetical protein GGI42DRAFT_320789 [Trichoderma sp. SZMC 28013]